MKNKKQTNKKSILPRIARSIGERSVSSACIWYFNQPKVPESMKNKANMK